jgi:hypothetical protein
MNNYIKHNIREIGDHINETYLNSKDTNMPIVTEFHVPYNVTYVDAMSSDFENYKSSCVDELKQPPAQSFVDNRHTAVYYTDYWIACVLGTIKREVWIGIPTNKPSPEWCVYDGQNKLTVDSSFTKNSSLRWWSDITGIKTDVLKARVAEYKRIHPYSVNYPSMIELTEFLNTHDDSGVCFKHFFNSDLFPILTKNLTDHVRWKITFAHEMLLISLMKEENNKKFPHTSQHLFTIDFAGTSYFPLIQSDFKTRNSSLYQKRINSTVNNSNLLPVKQLKNKTEGSDPKNEVFVKGNMLMTHINVCDDKSDVFTYDLKSKTELTKIAKVKVDYNDDSDRVFRNKHNLKMVSLNNSDHKKMNDIHEFNSKLLDVSCEWGIKQGARAKKKNVYSKFREVITELSNKAKESNNKNFLTRGEEGYLSDSLLTSLDISNSTSWYTWAEYVSKKWFTKYSSKVKCPNSYITDILELTFRELTEFVKNNFNSLCGDVFSETCGRKIPKDTIGHVVVIRSVLDIVYKSYTVSESDRKREEAIPVDMLLRTLGMSVRSDGFIFHDPLTGSDCMIDHNAVSDHVISDKHNGPATIYNNVIMTSRYNSMKNGDGFIAKDSPDYYSIMLKTLELSYKHNPVLSREDYKFSKRNFEDAIEYYSLNPKK